MLYRGGNKLGRVLIAHPFGKQIGAYLGIIDFAVKEHGWRKGAGFGVVFALNALYMHVFSVPVIGVLNVNMYLLRGEFVHQVRTAVPHARVVYAKIGAVFLYASRAHRIVAAKLKQAQEIYTRLGKGILQSIFVYRLHAYRICAHGFRRGLALNDGGGIIVIFLRAGYIALHHVGIAGIVRRVQHPFRARYPVLRGNLALLRAGIVIPFHAFAYFQRPGQSVVAYLPACGRSGLQIAVAVA